MRSVNRIHRLLQIVELLQSGRHYNSAQLADILAVSRRTVFRDLRTLEQSGLPVRYDEHEQGYLLPASLFLPPADLTLAETLSLLLLCHELGDRKRGVPHSQQARSAALKLSSNLPRHLRDRVGELTERMAVRIGPRNPLKDTEEDYAVLLKALAGRRCVRIRYNSLAEGKEITTLLSPYRVFFHRRSWYAIGRSSLHRAVRTFNLGRIHAAELIERHYRIPQRFSLDRHLGNAWSLIRERGKRYNVVVRFQPKVAKNVDEVRWHKTQRTTWNEDGTLDFSVTVDGLSEIVWWILGYGDQAEVLEPPELRKEIRRHVDALQKVYSYGESGGRGRSRKRH